MRICVSTIPKHAAALSERGASAGCCVVVSSADAIWRVGTLHETEIPSLKDRLLVFIIGWDVPTYRDVNCRVGKHQSSTGEKESMA